MVEIERMEILKVETSKRQTLSKLVIDPPLLLSGRVFLFKPNAVIC